MKTLLLIGCGSFAGGVLRYGVSRLLQGSQWLSLPLGTFCVNILGCLLLGICYGLLEHYRVLSEEIRLLFIVGFCGSFTTFSAFIHENLLLLRQSDLAGAALYVSLSVASGLLAVHAGHWLVKKSLFLQDRVPGRCCGFTPQPAKDIPDATGRAVGLPYRAVAGSRSPTVLNGG